MAETDGILQVGEVPIIQRKVTASVEDHIQAYRAGATEAYQHMSRYIQDLLGRQERYADNRPLEELLIHISDQIQGVNANGQAIDAAAS